MHLSENEGIEGVRFAVTGGQGFVGSALCLELLRRGAREVRSLDLRASSPWSDQLLGAGVRFFQGPPSRVHPHYSGFGFSFTVTDAVTEFFLRSKTHWSASAALLCLAIVLPPDLLLTSVKLE